MPTCNDCGEEAPLEKSLSGGSLSKRSRECPNCGGTVEKARSPHEIRK